MADDAAVHDDGQPPLGPFQPIWKAWEEAKDEIPGLPLLHFHEALRHQVVELREHLDADRWDAAANEGVDIVSIGLNMFRWLGLDPDRIRAVVDARAGHRMPAGGPLRPFQPLWDAREAAAESCEPPLSAFLERLWKRLERQVDQVGKHCDRGRLDAAANDVVDIIGSGLDVLRRLGYRPEEIPEIAENRAEKRMTGQTAQILEKYWVPG